jgi:hypothetical protein
MPKWKYYYKARLEIWTVIKWKRKINVSNAVNDYYKIQIFSGDSEKQKTPNWINSDNSGMDGTIIFNTPNYKVWVGNYKSRIEAERNLIDIKNISKRTFDSTKYIHLL